MGWPGWSSSTQSSAAATSGNSAWGVPRRTQMMRDGAESSAREQPGAADHRCVSSCASFDVMEDVDPFVQHSLHTSMFFPDSRLMVAGNPKAAGTALRWWLLGAHGIDVTTATKHAWWGESAPFQTVWDEGDHLRYIWPQLSGEGRRDAREAPDVLTVP